MKDGDQMQAEADRADFAIELHEQRQATQLRRWNTAGPNPAEVLEETSTEPDPYRWIRSCERGVA